MNQKTLKIFIISSFVSLYTIVSLISCIHVIDFFKLSNPEWLAITLALAFEIGAAASLASIIALKKMNKTIVWTLFFVLTAMQAMGNAYYTYTHLNNFQGWVELFGLVDNELIEQKRILSIVSGAILPLIALGFIKSLVDYIKPENDVITVKGEPASEINVNKNSVSDEKTEVASFDETNSTVKSEPLVVEQPVADESDEKKKSKLDSIDPETPKITNILDEIKVFKDGEHK